MRSSSTKFRPYTETTRLWSVNPGGEWAINDKLKLNFRANYARSTFHRESPTVGMTTPLGVGNTVTYSNTGGVPTITSALDLNDPKNFGWYAGSRVNIRRTSPQHQQGAARRPDLGRYALNLKVGGAFDNPSRQDPWLRQQPILAERGLRQQSQRRGPLPQLAAALRGLNAPAPPLRAIRPIRAMHRLQLGHERPGQLWRVADPQQRGAELSDASPAGFVTVNWPAFQAASNYKYFHDNAPENGGANTGASAGFIREIGQVRLRHDQRSQERAVNTLRFNVGVRYVNTIQTISGRVSLPDPATPRERRHAARWQPLSQPDQHLRRVTSIRSGCPPRRSPMTSASMRWSAPLDRGQ